MYVQIHDTHVYTHILSKYRSGKIFYYEVISLYHTKQEFSRHIHFSCTIKEGFTTYIVFHLLLSEMHINIHISIRKPVRRPFDNTVLCGTSTLHGEQF